MLRFCVARISNTIVLAYGKSVISEQVTVLMWTKSYFGVQKTGAALLRVFFKFLNRTMFCYKKTKHNLIIMDKIPKK